MSGLAQVVAAAATACLVWLLVSGPEAARVRLQPPPMVARPAKVERLPLGLRTAVGAGCGLVGGWLLWPTVLAMPVAVVAAVLIIVGLGRVRPPGVQRAAEQLAVALPGALDLLAGCLRAGAPLRTALGEVKLLTGGPLAERLGLVVTALELGSDEGAAWQVLAEDPQLGRLARDAVRSLRSGAPLVAVLGAHAERSRTARQQLLRAKARATGVRAVLPVTICFLPAFVLIGVVPIVAGAVAALLP